MNSDIPTTWTIKLLDAGDGTGRFTPHMFHVRKSNSATLFRAAFLFLTLLSGFMLFLLIKISIGKTPNYKGQNLRRELFP